MISDRSKTDTEAPANRLYRIVSQFQLQSMVLPGLVFLVVFSYIPMWGILMAFQNFKIAKGFWGSDWVWFENFRQFFVSPDFGVIMTNTLAISAFRLLICFPAPILLAILFNEVRHVGLKRSIQTITYLPYFVSWVVVSGMVFSLFSGQDGAINSLLMWAGVIKAPINFLNDGKNFWPILIGANLWKDIGFSAIIYIAAITGINPEYYEAAEIDGAGKLAKIVYITLPSIAPQIFILLILAISGILNAGFEDIYLLTSNLKNGIMLPYAQVLDTHVFTMGIQSMRYSYATAVGLFKSVISVVLLVLANQASRKVTGSSLW